MIKGELSASYFLFDLFHYFQSHHSQHNVYMYVFRFFLFIATPKYSRREDEANSFFEFAWSPPACECDGPGRRKVCLVLRRKLQFGPMSFPCFRSNKIMKLFYGGKRDFGFFQEFISLHCIRWRGTRLVFTVPLCLLKYFFVFHFMYSISTPIVDCLHVFNFWRNSLPSGTGLVYFLLKCLLQ